MSEKRSCSDCSLCEGSDRSRVEACPSPPLEGWKLSTASAVSFLLPVVCAIGGATASRGTAAWELLGGLLGFLFGIGAAFVLIRMTVRRRREDHI